MNLQESDKSNSIQSMRLQPLGSR